MHDMTLSRLFTVYVLAWGCAAISSPAQAISLGKLRGAALLGQALHVTIALQLSAQDEIHALCADAEVFYGENPLDRSRITVRVDPGERGGEPKLQIYASSAVDEPVVTLYVRMGCRQQSTRKYVLLADYISEAQTPLVDADTKDTPGQSGTVVNPSAAGRGGMEAVFPAPGQVSPRQAQNRAGGMDRPIPRGERKSGPVPQEVGDRRGKPSQHLPAVTAPPSKLQATPRTMASSKGPRLQLLPLDLTEAWEPSLKFSDAVLSTPLEDDPRRAQAAALWRALNATPDEVLRDSARLTVLAQEVKAMQSQTRRTQQSMHELGMHLQRVRDDRYVNPVLYVMAMLLALIAAIATYRWRRQQAIFQPWWMAQSESEGRPQDAPLPTRVSQEPVMSAPSAGEEARPEDHVDISLTDVLSPAADRPQLAPSSQFVPPQSEGSPSGHSDFAHSVTGSLRAINTQEMVDVRQQADFFLALGQHDDAIRVLQNGIGQSGDSNPLVFLDLVAVLHNLGRKEEYEQVRTTFNDLYTGYVPAFADYGTAGDGLLAYPQICEQIARLWPTERAMEFIEHCLVRDVTDSTERGFELSGFRDLLMLHGIVGKIVVPNIQASPYSPVDRTLPFIVPNALGGQGL